MRDPRERLRDILDAIGHIERYTRCTTTSASIRKSFGMSSTAISRISAETWRRAGLIENMPVGLARFDR